MNLFERAAVFTDIHFGKKNNSKDFNNDCLEFVKWFCEEAKEFNADTIIFSGDWHDTRRNLNVLTMNYSIQALKILNQHFNKIYFIPGNHDLYFRDNRTVNSIEFAKYFDNINIIEKPTVIDNVGLIPWLVEDEWKLIPDLKCRYMFGHFEIPNFILNGHNVMPDKGELNEDKFNNTVEFAFSGHFHKRQRGKKVWYIGNAFPHNYADAWDDERGLMLLEWGKEPTFRKWAAQPIYRTFRLSQIIDNPTDHLTDKTHARISIDCNLTYEEAAFIRETLIAIYKPKELAFVQSQKDETEFDFDDEIEFKSIDQIVIESLNGLDFSEKSTVSKDSLIELYHSLEIEHK